MKVLITGAAGRLGRRLAVALAVDHDLVLGDLLLLDDPRAVVLDVTDLDAARAAAQGCDAVVHMAILDWPPCSARDALRYAGRAIAVHATGTHNMLQAAWEAGASRFVHISSLSVVDSLPAGTPVGSDTRHYSNSIYGMTKGFGEDICRMFHLTMGLPVTVLRLGTLFTPEADGAWLGNVFFADAADQPAPGPGSSRVHVDDVARAIGVALWKPEPAYAIVNIVGADADPRWDQEAARQALGWEPRYAFGPDGVPREG